MTSPPRHGDAASSAKSARRPNTTSRELAAYHRPRIGDQADERNVAIFCTKSTAKKVLFQRYSDRQEAEAVANALARVGCPTTIEEIA